MQEAVMEAVLTPQLEDYINLRISRMIEDSLKKIRNEQASDVPGREVATKADIMVAANRVAVL
ncbi:MAG: hypothetical protein B0D92_07385 [Spirochaeta sp. LUC14_002_19_P3]|nr:MAG: hypothetical protein B0D92_07385 [Spirochaeta sp. LUC14_002_19_P3]